MLKILLVDDDPEEYELITSALESLKVKGKVIQVEHCQDVSGSIKEHKPDLVFMDINMPYLNGIECLKSVRGDRKFENLPVIMYSTSNNVNDIKESYDHRANLYVVKPDNFDKLINSLQKVLTFDWNLKTQLEINNFLIA